VSLNRGFHAQKYVFGTEPNIRVKGAGIQQRLARVQDGDGNLPFMTGNSDGW